MNRFKLYFEVIVLSVIILQLAFIQGSAKVIQIIQIARHGVRYPTFFPNGDFSNYTLQLRSAGQLGTQGKYMHYVLGQQLKKKYWGDLFANTSYDLTYNQSKFYIRSTNYNRTIESAQCQMLGWLEGLNPLTLEPADYLFSRPPWKGINNSVIPNASWNIFGNSAMSFRPIPVHIQKNGANIYDKGQFLLSTDWENCPYQQVWEQQNYVSTLGLQVANNADVLAAKRQLQTVLNTTLNLWQVYKYYDNYLSLKSLRQQYLPIFQDPQYSSTFNFIHLISFQFRNFYTDLQLKTGSTDILQQILARMKRVINNINTEQLILYMGHDSSVSSILSAFEYLDGQCIYDKFINRNNNLTYSNTNKSTKCFQQMPGFAHNVIFELTYQNSTYFVNVLYNGEYLNVPFCSTQNCTFDNFSNWVSKFVVSNPQLLCGIGLTEANPMYKVIIIMLCLLLGSLFIFALFIRSHVINKKNVVNKKNVNLIEQNTAINAIEPN